MTLTKISEWLARCDKCGKGFSLNGGAWYRFTSTHEATRVLPTRDWYIEKIAKVWVVWCPEHKGERLGEEQKDS